MLKNSKILIIILTSILIGIYLCIVIKKYTFFHINGEISFEINPFEFLVLVTNIFLAIYITRTLGREHDSQKSEKELLINYFLEYKSNLNQEISELLTQSDLMSVTTNARFKILRTRLFSIIGLAKESKLIEYNDVILSEISEKITEMWEFFTEAPKISQLGGKSVRIEIEKIRLEKISKIEQTNIAIEKLIFQLILKINKK